MAVNCWEGPFKHISTEGETTLRQMEAGQNIFRTTEVRPWTGSVLKNAFYSDDNDKTLSLRDEIKG